MRIHRYDPPFPAVPVYKDSCAIGPCDRESTLCSANAALQMYLGMRRTTMIPPVVIVRRESVGHHLWDNVALLAWRLRRDGEAADSLLELWRGGLHWELKLTKCRDDRQTWVREDALAVFRAVQPSIRWSAPHDLVAAWYASLTYQGQLRPREHHPWEFVYHADS